MRPGPNGRYETTLHKARQPRAHGMRGETDLFRHLTGATPFTILEHTQDRSVLSVDPLRPNLSRAQREAQSNPISSRTGAGNPLPRHSAIILWAPLPHWSERLGS